MAARHIGVLLGRQAHAHAHTVVETHSSKVAHGTLHATKAAHPSCRGDLLALDTTMVLHRSSNTKVRRSTKGGHDASRSHLLLQQLLLLLLECLDLSLQSHLLGEHSGNLASRATMSLRLRLWWTLLRLRVGLELLGELETEVILRNSGAGCRVGVGTTARAKLE
jgi:hypothetical protein